MVWLKLSMKTLLLAKLAVNYPARKTRPTRTSAHFTTLPPKLSLPHVSSPATADADVFLSYRRFYLSIQYS